MYEGGLGNAAEKKQVDKISGQRNASEGLLFG